MIKFPDTVWRFLKKLKIELPYDRAISLLGIYLEKMKTRTRKGACTPMFIAARFTIAKTWKQTKCPSTDEWMKMWSVYTIWILLSHKKEWHNANCSNMYGPRDWTFILSEVRKIQIYGVTYMWNLKTGYKRTYIQIELQMLKINLWLPGGGINWKIGIDIFILYVK